MKVIAFAGVSGSGKSTLIKDIQELLVDRCVVMDEASVGEVFKYLGFPFSFNSKLENTARVARHDFGRVEYQMLYENGYISNIVNKDKIVLIDKSVPCSLVYALTMSARFAGANLDSLIKEVKAHASHMYDLIVYLPYRHFDTTRDNLDRRISNMYVLECQDAVLEKIISWLPVETWTYSGSRKANVRQLFNYFVATGIIERENVSYYNI